MKSLTIITSLITFIICLFLAAVVRAEDWQFFKGEVKPEAIYSLPENQVRAGLGIELINYKEKASCDLLFAPANTTVGLGLAYKTNLTEALLDALKVPLPDKIREILGENFGFWGGIRDTFEPIRQVDYGFNATLIEFSF